MINIKDFSKALDFHGNGKNIEVLVDEYVFDKLETEQKIVYLADYIFHIRPKSDKTMTDQAKHINHLISSNETWIEIANMRGISPEIIQKVEELNKHLKEVVKWF